jgi:hypothetical protein
MKQSHRLVAAFLSVSLLAACGGGSGGLSSSTSLSVAPQIAAPQSAPLHHHGISFNYTGGQQSFTVPTGVTRITVQALGAAGGDEESSSSGGYVSATIATTPGESLYVYVGGYGGYNGGGAGGGAGAGGGGAGSSDGGGGGSSFVEKGATHVEMFRGGSEYYGSNGLIIISWK